MNAAHDSRSLFLAGPAGRLEAILWTPAQQPFGAASSEAAKWAAVVCHPHPLFGGTLHNKVAYQAAKSLSGLAIPVLRFNFRGAGLSEGTHDRGRGEVKDARAALDFLGAEFPGRDLLVAGFSFGSWVGLRAGCEDSRVARLIGMGIPVNSSDFSYLAHCAKPKLFVHGSGDVHGDVNKARQLVATLPDENRFVEVADADHFFTGKLEQLDRAITAWLSPVLSAENDS
jgi:alpha/beta superfamily hydrolase